MGPEAVAVAAREDQRLERTVHVHRHIPTPAVELSEDEIAGPGQPLHKLALGIENAEDVLRPQLPAELPEQMTLTLTGLLRLSARFDRR